MADYSSAISSGVSGLFGLIGAGVQQHHNREIMRFQKDANEQYLQQQLEYNTPKNQMLRYQEAGLNPNLIYGQGNAGSQSESLRAPQEQPADWQGAVGRIGSEFLPLYNQTRMVDAQVQATNAKTRLTAVQTALAGLQAQVMEKNPLLNEAGFRAIISGLVSTAEIKAAEAGVATEKANWFTGKKSMNIDGVPMHGPAGVLKMETELRLLEQRFNLGNVDAKIKAEILTGKEFQNAILEIQKKFMTDGDITPQHVYQFILSLLTKIR